MSVDNSKADGLPARSRLAKAEPESFGGSPEGVPFQSDSSPGFSAGLKVCSTQERYVEFPYYNAAGDLIEREQKPERAGRTAVIDESLRLTTTPAARNEVVVDGKRLETMWIEPLQPGRPTLVMLHEGLGSIALWKDFPAQLVGRTGCGVLVYSRYGHGNSDKLMERRPVRFMHHEGEVVLRELLDTLGIVRPVLVGHSDGGSIALIFAGKHPGAVGGLILEAPHVFVEDLSIASIAQAKVMYETTDFAARLGRYHANVDATFWGWNDIWLDPAFRSWNIEAYVPRIMCPVLCIQGEQDEYGTIAQVAAIKAGAPQTETLMLSKCKHSPHRDRVEKTLEAMAEFVGKVADGTVAQSRD